MLSLSKQDPRVALLDDLRRDIEGFWYQPLGVRTRSLRDISKELEWVPTIDVFEKNGELHVKADLPGVKKEDVKVEVDDGALVIRGQRKTESEVQEKDFYRAERHHGEFFRRMLLNFEADPRKIDARFADGVLEVTIPYPLEQKIEPRQIAVK
jgi:HSP20 family protein